MTTFGFSAFLKILTLADRPQRREVRSRLLPSTGGYDFHRSLRQRVARLLMDGEPLDRVLTSVGQISRIAERNSVALGLQNMAAWNADYPGDFVSLPSAAYQSPGGHFKVVFEPNFGHLTPRWAVAVHVYNNLRPPLIERTTYAALSLFQNSYAATDVPIDDVGVLSLRTQRLFRLREAGDYRTIGEGMIDRLERLFVDVRREIGESPRGPRPLSPPPL